MRYRFLFRVILPAGAAILASAALTAHAGFKLIAPPASPETGVESDSVIVTPAAPAVETPLPAPVAGKKQAAPLITEPVIISEESVTHSATDIPANILREPAGRTMNAAMAAPPPAESAVKGFGRDIPLHIALRQIAPAGTEFAYGPGVNPARSVSWQGGQNWRDVLSATLRPRGLVFAETGSVLYIQQDPALTPRIETAVFNAEPFAAAPGAVPAPARMPEPVPAPAALPEPVAAPSTGPAFADPMMVSLHSEPAPVQTVRSETIAAPVSAAPVLPPVTENRPPVVLDNATLNRDSDRASHTVVTETSERTIIESSEPVAEPVSIPPVMMTDAQKVVPAAPDQPAIRTWTASPGSTLRSTLEKWSAELGVELTWESEYDYPIRASVTVNGTFDDAVRSLLKGFQTANPPPKGQIFTGQGHQSVLLITALGNDYTN